MRNENRNHGKVERHIATINQKDTIGYLWNMLFGCLAKAGGERF